MEAVVKLWSNRRVKFEISIWNNYHECSNDESQIHDKNNRN